MENQNPTEEQEKEEILFQRCKELKPDFTRADLERLIERAQAEIRIKEIDELIAEIRLIIPEVQNGRQED